MSHQTSGAPWGHSGRTKPAARLGAAAAGPAAARGERGAGRLRTTTLEEEGRCSAEGPAALREEGAALDRGAQQRSRKRGRVG
jgi:hypothetical protein